MQISGFTAIVYSIFLFIGGMIGYQKAHSMASLIMGSVFALLLLAAGIGMLKQSVLAFFSAVGFSLLLAIFFTYRFYLTGKFFPAGMMALVSFIVLVVLLLNKSIKAG